MQHACIKLINDELNRRKTASRPCNSNLNMDCEMQGDYTTMKSLAKVVTIQAMKLYNKYDIDA